MLEKLGIGNVMLVGTLMASVLGLAGCAPKGVVFAKPSAFTVLKTTRQEVYDKVGFHPNAFGTLHKNGTWVKSMTYAQTNPFGRGFHPDVTPMRAERFYFVNDLLVGMDYTSSYAEDSTDFDASKVTQIKKGKTTRAQVIAMFGKPGGIYAPPMIADGGYRALVYKDYENAGVEHISSKLLIVTYDRKDVVTDVKFNAVGQHH